MLKNSPGYGPRKIAGTVNPLVLSIPGQQNIKYVAHLDQPKNHPVGIKKAPHFCK